MSTIIKVGMADYKVARKPDVLTTLGLGSCVGVCLYDKTTGVIGMVHVMLPFSSLDKEIRNPGKYADSGIPILIADMIKLGAHKASLVAKISGGAQMFAFASESDLMRVGKKNIEATKQILKELGIPLLADVTGGNKGRTIELYAEDGRLLIKTVGEEPRVI